jgi:predicted transcriptional regulator
MSSAKSRTPSPRVPASREPVVVTRDVPKATTFRLDPTLQAGLTVLAQLTKKPLNRLVNEAVQSFIQKRSHEVEADLEASLKRLRAARKNDPTFKSAIARFAQAEASLGSADPVEGRPVEDGRMTKAGPTRTMVHGLLRG